MSYSIEVSWDDIGHSTIIWRKSRKEWFLVGIAVVNWNWHERRRESIYNWGVKIINTVTMEEVKYKDGPDFSHYCWEEDQAKEEAIEAFGKLMKDAEAKIQEDREYHYGMFDEDGIFYGVALKAGVIGDECG